VSPSSLKNVTVPVARRCRGRPKGTDKSLNVKYGTREANRKKPAHNRKLPVADATAQPLSCSASDNCAECGLRDPRKTTKRAKLVNWVQCDKCQFWYHECCISNVPSKSQADYVCVRCAQCLRLFINVSFGTMNAVFPMYPARVRRIMFVFDVHNVKDCLQWQ